MSEKTPGMSIRRNLILKVNGWVLQLNNARAYYLQDQVDHYQALIDKTLKEMEDRGISYYLSSDTGRYRLKDYAEQYDDNDEIKPPKGLSDALEAVDFFVTYICEQDLISEKEIKDGTKKMQELFGSDDLDLNTQQSLITFINKEKAKRRAYSDQLNILQNVRERIISNFEKGE